MLEGIYGRLVAAGLRLPQTWSDEVTKWGQQVALFRQYAEGDHRAKLTPEMRDMLRISGSMLDTFTLNYCDLVIAKMGDRLTVAGIDADTDAGSTWAAQVLDANRFDGLQMDVQDAALRDGITFVMVAPHEDGSVMLAHELAWDGDTGTIPVYDRMGKRVVAAVKVWYEHALERRVNIYFPDRVEKFDLDVGGGLMVHADNGEMVEEFADRGEVNGVVPWVSNGQALGVPVIPFVNRAKARLSYGISEIAGVIPGQDALNRTLVSMVMTAELSAFQIKVARGFQPPAAVAPGSIITIGAEGLSKDQLADMTVLEQASLVPFISEAQFLIEQMGTISQTPLPGQMGGDAASGESLKQREIGLLGKVKRFQVKAGNAWEDVMKMAAIVQNAYSPSSRAPAVKRWVCRWEDADIRNDAEVIANAIKMRELVGDKEVLRLVAPVWGYTAQQIDAILAEKRAQVAQSLAAMTGGGLDNFDNFTVPVQ